MLRVFNSMTKQKEEFVPLKPGKVGIYVCGVTPYDFSHVGHARVYVVFDTIVRWLRRDHQVTYVRNFTDVDDKIIQRARAEGEDPIARSARFADAFLADMDRLGVAKPDVEPRVTTHMPEIIRIVGVLEEKGFAYRVPSTSPVEGAGSDLYFRVKKMDEARYLQLSGRLLDDMRAGARVAIDERKEDPLDFALWKSAKPDEPWWSSPFGNGRPGWHIECSAMAEKHLGVTFDIHGGGKDLVFPHHTNEIAQSECAHGTTMSRYWLHNGFINFDGEKMSKSLGNFFTIRDVLEFATPEALRFFLLATHYRGDVSFDVTTRCAGCRTPLTTAEQNASHCNTCGRASSREEMRTHIGFPNLEEAEGRVQYLYETKRRVTRALARLAREDGPSLEHAFHINPWGDFVAAMEDDFNTPKAIAALTEALKVQNALVDDKEQELGAQKLKPGPRAGLLLESQHVVDQMCEILGVGRGDPAAFLPAQRTLLLRARGIDEAEVLRLLTTRAGARAKKDWPAADAARDELGKLGIEVRDTPEGVDWSVG